MINLQTYCINDTMKIMFVLFYMIIITNPGKTILMTSKNYNNNYKNIGLLLIKTRNTQLYHKKYNINNTYFTCYSQFMKNVTDQNAYGFFTTNISFGKEIDKIDVVLLGNHGYNKIFDLLFVFDILFFSRFEIKKHFKIAVPIIFLSDIISTALVLYSLPDDGVNEFDNFIILFENHYYDKNLVNLIYRHAPVKSNIKTYFKNYNNLINLLKNKDEANLYFIKPVFSLSKVYKHDKENFRNVMKKIETFRHNKVLLGFLNKSPLNYNVHGLSSYFNCFSVITKQRIFSVFITPKELSHKMRGVTKPLKNLVLESWSEFATLVAEYRNMFLLETKDTLFIFDKNIYENEEEQHKNIVDTLNTNHFFALVFRKIAKLFLRVNIPNKPIIDNIDAYISKNNWLDLSFLEYRTDRDNIIKVFAVHLVRPISLVMNNRQFDTLFMQFTLKYTSIQNYEKIKHCFVANSSSISKVPFSILVLLMDPNDIKDINKFIIKNIQVENVSFYHTMYFITEPLDIEIEGIFENLKSNIKVNKNHTKHYIFTFSCVFEVKQVAINEGEYVINILDFDNKRYFIMKIKNNDRYRNEDIEQIIHKIKVMSNNSSVINFSLSWELSFAVDKKQAVFLEKEIKKNKGIKVKRISGLFHISYLDLTDLKAGFYLSGVLGKHLVELA